MNINNYNHLLDILSKIELEFGKNTKIILTSIYSNGIYGKKIFLQKDLSNLILSFPLILTKYILNILDSQKAIGYVSLQDVSGSEILYIIEIIKPLNSIIILGAGHVGRSLSIFASLLGLEVTLVDDRKEFLQNNKLSAYDIKKVISSYEDYFELASFHSNCAIIIVTRGHQFDEICLRRAIDTEAKYIGMIGSKRRVLVIMNNLIRDGLSDEQLQKLESIYAPIGIKIGAKSPQEIAVSILAQVISVMNYSTK